MKRLEQIVLLATFVGFSWLAMQAVHESGHVIGALVSGGVVTKVVLYPTAISRTDVFPNPHPLVEVWAGPLVGVILPAVAFLAAAALRAPGLYLFRFFAGFCLVSNGVYIGAGSFQGVADAGELILHGARHWQLWLFGVATLPVGLYLWNGLGTAFGLGSADGQVSRAAAITSLCLFGATIGVEMAIGSR